MRFFNYENLARSKWDSEIINLLSQIHEHKGKQELFLTRKPAVLDKLVEIAKIQSVEDSNRIEGIVTTAVRIKELMNQKTTPRNRDEEEILGYRDVPVSYTHLTLPTTLHECRSRWSPYH